MPCCSFCCCSYVLYLFCPCFHFCLSSFGRLGSPNLLAGPRRDHLLLVLSCPCLSSSGLWSCCCPIGSKSCIYSRFSVLSLCFPKPLSLPSPNVACVLPCSSRLVYALSGVGCDGDIVGCVGGVSGGGLGSGASRLGLLFLVPCRNLPLASSRWWSEPSFDQVLVCRKFVLAITLDAVVVAIRFVSCSFGRFVLLGGMCRPGCLVYGKWSEGCRPQSLRCVASGVHPGSNFVPMAAVLVDTLYCYIAECCDDGVDEMVDAIVPIIVISGLSHAGDEHTCSLPDSATYNKPATPRSLKFLLKFGRRIDCFIHEHDLHVTKALGHPKPFGAGCPLGGGHWRRNWPYQCPWPAGPTPRAAAGSATLPTRT